MIATCSLSQLSSTRHPDIKPVPLYLPSFLSQIRQFLGGNCAATHDLKSQRGVATHFFGLFDGHAGGRCSKHISAALPEVLLEDSLFLSNLPLALKRSYHTANDVFLKIAEQQRLHDGSQQESGLSVGVHSLQGKRPYQEDEYAVSFFPHSSATYFLNSFICYPFHPVNCI